MTLEQSEVGTYYIPEGTSRTIRFVHLRRGNEESRPVWTDDNGTLEAIVRVEEADTDGLLWLQQYGADRLIRRLLVLEASGAWDPESQPVKVTRPEAGAGYEVEVVMDD